MQCCHLLFPEGSASPSGFSGYLPRPVAHQRDGKLLGASAPSLCSSSHPLPLRLLSSSKGLWEQRPIPSVRRSSHHMADCIIKGCHLAAWVPRNLTPSFPLLLLLLCLNQRGLQPWCLEGGSVLLGTRSPDLAASRGDAAGMTHHHRGAGGNRVEVWVLGQAARDRKPLLDLNPSASVSSSIKSVILIS